MKQTLNVLLAASLIIAFSCGSDDNGDGNSRPAQEQEDGEGSNEGTFRAILTPLNGRISNASGEARISVVEDVFRAEVKMEDTDALVVHPQFVTTGSACPTLENSDLN